MNARVSWHPSDLQGLSRLAIEGVSGTTELVEQVHLAIARVSGPSWPAKHGRTRGITGLVYRSIQGVTGMVGSTLDWSLSQIVPRMPDLDSTPQRDRALALLNGVLGDHLEQSDNPLALNMTLRRNGRVFSSLPATGRKIAVFIHGLCMNEQDWAAESDKDDAIDLPRLLEDRAGYLALKLRYNTGRSIGHNGRDLAELLESLLNKHEPPLDELVLIGHSMGGLVARSAIAQGRLAGHGWAERLSRLITLGSPHHGAPLEKIGHLVDRGLGLTPFSRPFARLGQIRSAGITDLRNGQLFGSVDPAQASAFEQSFPSQLKLYAVAGTLADCARSLKSHTLGDGLVTVNSALGRQLPAAHRPPPERRMLVAQCGHLRLLKHRQAGEQIFSWLQED
ncbi:MAG: esterase/lipase family protein [Wenzhouxiangella sp.]